MFVDKELEFSSEQAVTAAAASTNIVDLGSSAKHGVGKKKYVVITCKEASTSGGAATVDFKLESDTDSGFGSATVIDSTGAIGKASIILGYQVVLEVPARMLGQYLRVYYGVATANLTAGKFDAHVVENIDSNTAYPDAL